jgi:putative addiction module component (TIGR02574 family)
MSEAVAQILTQMPGFSREERAELAYAFVCSLDSEEDMDAKQAWDIELDRRVAEIQSGQAIGKPAEQLFAELRASRP